MHEKCISVIIPNYNGSATIGKCIEAALASQYGNFEVIVVDDCSTDNSVEIIRNYPCKLVRMERRSGAGAARNRGAKNSAGELFFFTDADCLIQENTLALANKAAAEQPGSVIGGTYTPLPYDDDFFSAFQSLFIHYSETKRTNPDYVAGHAMLIDAALFGKSGGFVEERIPVPEDVAFSHQLRRAGVPLIMRPEIQVMHVFNFTLMKSLRNGFRKSMNWTGYSLANKDLFADSGTASLELKVNGIVYLLNAVCLALFLDRNNLLYLLPVPFLCATLLFFCRKLIAFFFHAKGSSFAFAALFYFAAVYPLAVGFGGLMGSLKHFLKKK